MTVVVLVFLAVLWGLVFLPALFKARRNASPAATVSSFHRGLKALGGGQPSSSGRWVVMPPDPARPSANATALGRRRKVFTVLVGISTGTFILGMWPPLRMLLWLNLFSDLALAAMVCLLIMVKTNRLSLDGDRLAFEGEGGLDTTYYGRSRQGVPTQALADTNRQARPRLAGQDRRRPDFVEDALGSDVAFSQPPKLTVVQNSYIPKHSAGVAKEQDSPRRQPGRQSAKWGLLNMDEDAYASL